MLLVFVEWGIYLSREIYFYGTEMFVCQVIKFTIFVSKTTCNFPLLKINCFHAHLMLLQTHVLPLISDAPSEPEISSLAEETLVLYHCCIICNQKILL